MTKQLRSDIEDALSDIGLHGKHAKTTMNAIESAIHRDRIRRAELSMRRKQIEQALTTPNKG